MPVRAIRVRWTALVVSILLPVVSQFKTPISSIHLSALHCTGLGWCLDMSWWWLLLLGEFSVPNECFCRTASIPCLPAPRDGSSLLSRAWGGKAQFSTAHRSLGCAVWKPWHECWYSLFYITIQCFCSALAEIKNESCLLVQHLSGNSV